MNGNIFAGDYFKFNSGHLAGKLHSMKRDGLTTTPHKVLKIEKKVQEKPATPLNEDLWLKLIS